jgi:hypothetical protein
MDMAMVREAAASYFVDRLDRFDICSPGKSKQRKLTLSGWLELRKGFYTYLSESGNFFIFRNGTLLNLELKKQSNRRNPVPTPLPTPTPSSLPSWKYEYELVSAIKDISFTLDSLTARPCILPKPSRFIVKGWEIDISVVDKKEEIANEPFTDSMSEACFRILNGEFEYAIKIESPSTLLTFSTEDFTEICVFHIPEDEFDGALLQSGVYRVESISSVSLTRLGFDRKLRNGLPLLQALSLSIVDSFGEDIFKTEEQSNSPPKLYLKLVYRWVG